MMWRSPIAGILLVFMPCAVFAQSSAIQSGEHANFTRLVAPIPVGSDWQVEQEGRKVTLSVDGYEDDFNTTNVFQLVPRERIIDINSESGVLTVTLGCDCIVAPFLVRNRFVVLDVAEQGTKLASDPITPRVVAEVLPIIAPEDLPENPQPSETLQAGTNETEVPINEPEVPIKLPLIPERKGQSISQHLKPVDLPGRVRVPLTEREQSALKEMQQRLAAELSTAATRGVLNPLPGRPLTSIVPEISEGRAEMEFSEAERSARPTVPPPSTNNIRITSSGDMAPLARRAQETRSMTGLACPKDEAIEVATWADDRPFHEQIGEARRNLFGEFDKLNRKWAIKSAKIYIHFGFGAEALQILALDPKMADDQPFLIDLAHIMENGSAPENSRLPSLVDCETDVALWAIIAKEEMNVTSTIDPRAALLALNKLPVHLRRFIAPALSQRLLSHGDSGAAAMALRNLERLPAALPTAAKLALANIAIDEGELTEGAHALEDVIDDNAAQSPQALITLVETQLNDNQPVDPETASLIEAYAKELQDSKLGPALRRAHVLALVKSAQFDRAFSAMQQLGAETEEKAALELRLQVLKEVTAAAEDVVFLEHVFDRSDRDIGQLANRPKISLATRLINLGFAGRAQPILASIPERPLDPERQILLARAALMLEEPQKALAELSETQGAQADEIRAQAQLLIGAYSDAYALFHQNDRTAAAVDAAWLAEEFDRQALGSDPLFGPVLTLVDTPTETSNVPDGMLERSSAALNESELARQTLQNFLSNPQLAISTEDAVQ